MSKTYTRHKLTDAQLVRLSQIVNQHPNRFGNALYALVAKNLVYEKPDAHLMRYSKDCFYEPTGAGVLALDKARGEGW